jgi:hypothetical protein
MNTDIIAIAAALQQYFAEPHDRESNVLTIKRIHSVNSAWNFKILGMNNLHK